MGNCAGYCITEGADNKMKVTVEQGFYSVDSVRKNQEGTQATEFEIEYGNKLQTRGQSEMEQAVKNKRADGEEKRSDSFQPITLPNGSVYTGQRINQKKNGRGQ